MRNRAAEIAEEQALVLKKMLAEQKQESPKKRPPGLVLPYGSSGGLDDGAGDAESLLGTPPAAGGADSPASAAC